MFTKASITAVVVLATALGTTPVQAKELPLLNETVKHYEMSDAKDMMMEIITGYALENNILVREEDIMDSVMELEDFDATVNTSQTVKVHIKMPVNGKMPMADTITETMLIDFVGTQAPALSLETNETTIAKDASFNPYDYIESLCDDSGITPGLVIDNPVDANTPGTYTVTYQAMDTQGNISEETLEVTVQKPRPVVKQQQATTTTTTTQAPARASAYMRQGSGNPYGGGWSNCTWSAWTLASQYAGVSLPSWGNAGSWIYNAASDGYITSSYPSPYCIAVYSGHVALVTAVNGDAVFIKEGGFMGGYNERWVSVYGTGTQGCLGYIWLHG